MKSTFGDAQTRLTEVFKHVALTDDVQGLTRIAGAISEKGTREYFQKG